MYFLIINYFYKKINDLNHNLLITLGILTLGLNN